MFVMLYQLRLWVPLSRLAGLEIELLIFPADSVGISTESHRIWVGSVFLLVLYILFLALINAFNHN